jgi:hypothetical protein
MIDRREGGDASFHAAMARSTKSALVGRKLTKFWESFEDNSAMWRRTPRQSDLLA